LACAPRFAACCAPIKGKAKPHAPCSLLPCAEPPRTSTTVRRLKPDCRARPSAAARFARRRRRRSKPSPPRALSGGVTRPPPLTVASRPLEHSHGTKTKNHRPPPLSKIQPLPFVSHAGEHIIAILSISSLRFASHPNP
jgi:hypothetical protein